MIDLKSCDLFNVDSAAVDDCERSSSKMITPMAS